MTEKKVIICDSIKSSNKSIMEDTSKNVIYLSSKKSHISTCYEDLSLKLLYIIKNIVQERINNEKLIIQFVLLSTAHPLYLGLTSFFKTLEKEISNFNYQIITFEDKKNYANLLQCIELNSEHLEDKEVLYKNGNRYVKQLKETEIELPNNVIWKEGGVYLITGGAGKIGQAFVTEISSILSESVLILVGRRNLNEEISRSLKRQNYKNNRIKYIPLDVTDEEKVQILINNIIHEFGTIDGIIHAAGTINDSFFLNKKVEDFKNVLKPKVYGTINLDEATKNIDLDFMALFSSGVSELGNYGQIDYGTANGFLDQFALYRNNLVRKGLRFGKTVSIDWPLWKEGGMKVDTNIENSLKNLFGMVPMETKVGIRNFYKAINSKYSQVLVMDGNLKKFKETQTSNVLKDKIYSNIKGKEITEDVIANNVVEIFCRITKIPVDLVDYKKNFDTYGINSIQITKINNDLQNKYPTIDNTLIFECKNLSELINNIKRNISIDNVNNTIKVNDKIEKQIMKNTSDDNDFKDLSLYNDIGIIGMSGKFSSAKDIFEFEKLLTNGQNYPTEIPKDRWDSNSFYEPIDLYRENHQKSYSKWGFFLDDIFKFDPVFFNISPINAIYIDPQERLFLEESWKAIIDAGYTKERLKKIDSNKIGVYGAVTKNDFNVWNGFNRTSPSSMVNRLSYFMNFKGPSVPFDSMCSSMFVALQKAVEDIRLKKVDMAIVGGVNLYLHPNEFISLSHGKMISKDNKNKVLSKDSSGFTPSEGAGAIVIKRLDLAEKDGDNVLSIIKSIKITHSGRTSGYNVPDPLGEANTISSALNDAKLRISDEDLIELSVNGSPIADNVETGAVKKIIGNKPQSISAIKSIIGNGEAVSGVSQIIKSILEINNNVIYPSKVDNNDIKKLQNEGLIISNQMQKMKNIKQTNNSPLRVGINSFSAGGVYGHLILEQYVNKHKLKAEKSKKNYLFVFSARTDDALHSLLITWVNFLSYKKNIRLDEMAYILLNRREIFRFKFATVACSKKELIDNLNSFLQNRDNLNNFSNPINLYQSNKIAENKNKVLKWFKGEIEYINNDNKNNICGFPTYSFSGDDIFIEKLSKEGISKVHETFIPIDDVLNNKKQDEHSTYNVKRIVKEALKSTLLLKDEDLNDDNTSFSDLGIDSVLITKFINYINKELNIKLQESILFSYPNINSLVIYINSLLYGQGEDLPNDK